MRPPTVSDDTVALPAASNASAMGEGAKRSSAYRRRKSGDVRKGKIRASNSIASPVPRSPPKGLWSVLAQRGPCSAFASPTHHGGRRPRPQNVHYGTAALWRGTKRA